MLKKSCAIAAVALLAACGPSPAPQSQNTAATPPPAASAPPQAAAAPAPAPAPAPEPKVAEAPKPTHHHKTVRHREESAPAEASEQSAQQNTPPPAPVCQDCGVIASVQQQRVKGEAGLVGTLGGAGAGGLLGNQFGHGKGKTAMTVVGVIGGALAGREVEKQVNAKTVYSVTVNMDDGTQRVVTVDALNGLGVGSRVKVIGNNLQYLGG
jgi:outer membrane lipoprotein SlyB